MDENQILWYEYEDINDRAEKVIGWVYGKGFSAISKYLESELKQNARIRIWQETLKCRGKYTLEHFTCFLPKIAYRAMLDTKRSENRKRRRFVNFSALKNDGYDYKEREMGDILYSITNDKNRWWDSDFEKFLILLDVEKLAKKDMRDWAHYRFIAFMLISSNFQQKEIAKLLGQNRATVWHKVRRMEKFLSESYIFCE